MAWGSKIMKNILLIPRVSEKAYAMSQTENVKTYVFEVPTDANKHTVARAVGAQYEVTVTDVRTTMLKGKTKQTYRKGSRPQAGKRSDIKKAYVTLKAGDELPLFAEVAAQEAEVAKATEKAAKKTAKESK
ncbi:MAG: 50S ribosomal protein L23 [bacterium]|nr:50S ribosomal protein L23 [bacterium]